MKTNQPIIMAVVATVCFLSCMCIATLCACAFWKIPSMSDAHAAALAQISATLIGALVGMLVSTRSQEQRKGENGDGADTVVTSGDVIANQPTLVTNAPTQPKP